MSCFKCKGKGGYEQADSGDDSGNTSWDLCEVCDGSGDDSEFIRFEGEIDRLEYEFLKKLHD